MGDLQVHIVCIALATMHTQHHLTTKTQTSGLGRFLSRILLRNHSNFVYFTLRSWLFPRRIATRLSPWHVLSSYCLPTCFYCPRHPAILLDHTPCGTQQYTQRYTMRYLTLLLLFLTILDRQLCLPVADNMGLDRWSAWVNLGARRCSLLFSTLYTPYITHSTVALHIVIQCIPYSTHTIPRTTPTSPPVLESPTL
jgi:hypothetical protein